ncbi:hypothetical protein RCH12_000623, partial [Cryobacterium sp. MP_3.1]|uniref:hypothetical protein n=1 Tax=Cryobacterium sp. MP_3.1 TaxID=3071711 RepID=UPI002DFEDA8E|nr:hypothetical protein [Cryobacterium sp. MP_3.1]
MNHVSSAIGGAARIGHTGATGAVFAPIQAFFPGKVKWWMQRVGFLGCGEQFGEALGWGSHVERG